MAETFRDYEVQNAMMYMYSVYTNIHITYMYMYMYMAYSILPHQLVHAHVAIRKFLVKLQPFLIIMGVHVARH